MGVPNEEKTKTQSGKNKIKTLLTRPASLEMNHYQKITFIASLQSEKSAA
jgi:hypothetical protein